MFPVALPAPPSSGSPVIGTIGLISRLGWKRAGTRFNTRGVDDEGNVANFVEVSGGSCITLGDTNGSLRHKVRNYFQYFGDYIQLHSSPRIRSSSVLPTTLFLISDAEAHIK